MLTQCIVNLLNYPKEDFRTACITELTNTFRHRLVDADGSQQFDEIIRSQFRHSDGQSSYFAPTGPKSSSFVSMTEEEWTEIVSRNLAVCCK